MDKESFVTYWPHSSAFYVGDHSRSDPGLDSGDLLAVTTKDHKTQLKNSSLISTTRQIGSSIAVANDSNLEHLQVIRLHEEIMGRPEQPFFLEQSSTVRNTEMLESRETFRAVNSSVVSRKGRLEEAKEGRIQYDEIRYDVTKLAGKTLTPIEDKLRTIKDPEKIDLENLDFDFALARNDELKEVIKKGITKGASGGAVTALGNILTVGTKFHSEANIANAISAAIRTFRTRNRLPIDTVVMDVTSYDLYTSNTWTGAKAGPNNIEPKHLPNGGILELSAFPGVNVIVEPELEDDKKMYFINKAHALRTAQGPLLYRRYYDENKHAESVSVLDFVQFLSVDAEIDHSKIGDRYFSFLANYTTS